MAKPAKSKTTTEHRSARKSNNSHHGRTFCKRCTAKIAKGMMFCNAHCRELYTAASRDRAAG